jgi:peptidoglycan/LPS O-acetylase OafA/YrhL
MDIQGLRAFAVALVVIFHIWPKALSGGFIGVDVFFVISGYLITAHLLSEVQRSGTVSVTRFWARRIRRLLPASFLVLAVCVVLAFTVMPKSVLTQNLQEIGASAGYFLNWLLAFNAVDYLGASNADSLVQHYWSLSVEEQFYVVWPLLIIAAVFLATKIFNTRRAPVIAIVLGLVFAASLGYSIIETHLNQPFAYFITPTRAWEFAAGGLIAFLPVLKARTPAIRTIRILASWSALALVLGSAFLLDGESPFPGWVALIPVLGTVYLLWNGDDSSTWSPQFLTHPGPIQFVGDVSYSVYLWHWPLIVATPFVLGHGIGLGTGLAIGAASIGLAAATKYLVEDPVRTVKGRWRLRWPAFTFMAIGMALLLAVYPVAGAVIAAQANDRQDIVAAAETSPCLGASVLVGTNLDDCAAADPLGSLLAPDPLALEDDLPSVYGDECRTSTTSPVVLTSCIFDPSDGATPSRTIALLGDSHAASWFPTLRTTADRQGWRLVVYFKAACPFNAGVLSSSELDQVESCFTWNQGVLDALSTLRPDAIVTSAQSNISFAGADGDASQKATVQGFVDQWERALGLGIGVIVIEDVPHVGREQIECAQSPADLLLDCTLARDRAFDDRQGRLGMAADEISQVQYLDFSDAFCRTSDCPTVLGHTIVYRDTSSHLTNTFAETLVPVVSAAIVGAVDAAIAAVG